MLCAELDALAHVRLRRPEVSLVQQQQPAAKALQAADVEQVPPSACLDERVLVGRQGGLELSGGAQRVERVLDAMRRLPLERAAGELLPR